MRSTLELRVRSQTRLDANEGHALLIGPGLVLARYNLARAGQVLGPMDEAAAHHHKVLDIDGDHAEAHNNLQGQGRVAKARQHFLQAVNRSPLLVHADNNLGNAPAEEKHWDEASTSFGPALHVEPSTAEVYNNLGKIWGAGITGVRVRP